MDSQTRPTSQGSKKSKPGSRAGTKQKNTTSSGPAKPAKKSAKTTAGETTKKVTAKRTTTATTATPRKKATPATAVSKSAVAVVVESLGRSVSADERRGMIAEAAYYRAQRQGGATIDPARNWLEAEAEIDALLMADRKGE